MSEDQSPQVDRGKRTVSRVAPLPNSVEGGLDTCRNDLVVASEEARRLRVAGWTIDIDEKITIYAT